MELIAEQQRLALDKQRQEMEFHFAQLMEMLTLRTAEKQSEIKLEAAHEQAQIKSKAQADSKSS